MLLKSERLRMKSRCELRTSGYIELDNSGEDSEIHRM